jgi:hypothetical protein
VVLSVVLPVSRILAILSMEQAAAASDTSGVGISNTHAKRCGVPRTGFDSSSHTGNSSTTHAIPPDISLQILSNSGSAPSGCADFLEVLAVPSVKAAGLSKIALDCPDRLSNESDTPENQNAFGGYAYDFAYPHIAFSPGSDSIRPHSTISESSFWQPAIPFRTVQSPQNHLQIEKVGSALDFAASTTTAFLSKA